MSVKAVSIRLPIRSGGDVTGQFDGYPTTNDIQRLSDLAESISSRNEELRLAYATWQDSCSSLRMKIASLNGEVGILQRRIKEYTTKVERTPERHVKRAEEAREYLTRTIERYNVASKELDEASGRLKELTENPPKRKC